MTKKRIQLSFLVGIFLSIILVGMYRLNVAKQADSQAVAEVEQMNKLESENQKYVQSEETFDVVIDPGHGGDDPGKVGINQAKEKDINLIIAQKIAEILKSKDYTVKMTRTRDQGMVPQKEFSKVGDLAARVQIINDIAPALSVSIHQNSYTDEAIKGAQVFYHKASEEGEKAAAIMQGMLKELDSKNHREIKSNDSYYLLNRTQYPTIIVECGFLSNASEADKLVDKEYQSRMAETIARGIEEYLKAI